jgi:uncharacterized protein YecT (DUF1311 family)
VKINAEVTVAFILGVLFCVPGRSQTPDWRTAENTPQKLACAQQSLSSAEEDMGRAFRKALETYAPDAAQLEEEKRMDKLDRAEAVRYRTAMQHQLRMSQRTWLAYRREACAAVLTMYQNGTIGPASEVGCREALTRERTNHLLSYFVQR